MYILMVEASSMYVSNLGDSFCHRAGLIEDVGILVHCIATSRQICNPGAQPHSRRHDVQSLEQKENMLIEMMENKVTPTFLPQEIHLLSNYCHYYYRYF